MGPGNVMAVIISQHWGPRERGTDPELVEGEYAFVGKSGTRAESGANPASRGMRRVEPAITRAPSRRRCFFVDNSVKNTKNTC